MSRVGLRPIVVPNQVKVEVQADLVVVEGPKGKLTHRLPPGISLDRQNGQLLVKRTGEDKGWKSLHGLTRTLIDNMVIGVTQGFVKELEIVGVGYRAQLSSNKLELFVGLTHPVVYPIPPGVTVETPKPTQVIVKGLDKALVGQVAARLRGFAKPEPYKGKGIRYAGEVVRRKAGKAVA